MPTMTMTTADEAKPEITTAVARGDLARVRRITRAAAAVSHDAKIKTLNRARKWRECSAAYKTEDNPRGVVEWFDVTPLTTAAIRGHDAIVEYLLQEGADPTLKGCPKDDVAPLHDGGAPLLDLPELHMNAFDAADRLCRKIRRCRRTHDLCVAAKPYWKRCVYSGSSAMRHKRTVFSSLPLGPESLGDGKSCHLDWVLDALGQVPALQDYPLKPKSFHESITVSTHWKNRKRVVEEQQNTNDATANRSGGQRRCSSCGALKPEPSYNRNERKKGAGARCISCVATNPGHEELRRRRALELSTAVPVHEKPVVNDHDAMHAPGLPQTAGDTKEPTPSAKEEAAG